MIMPARRWTFERGIFYGIVLDGSIPRVTPRVDATWQEVTAGSAGELAEAMGLSDEAVHRRLSTGRRCLVARVRNEIVAYGWVSQCTEYIGEQEREIRLQADEAYIWDCATLPAFRGQHLYSGLLSYSLRVLRDERVRRVWIGTGVSNHASRRGFVRAGFLPVLTVTHARLLNLGLLWARADPRAPREWVAGARRAFSSADERVWGPLAISWSTPALTREQARIQGHA